MFTVLSEDGPVAHAVQETPLARWLILVLEVAVVDGPLRRRVAHLGVVHRPAHRQELVARQPRVLHVHVGVRLKQFVEDSHTMQCLSYFYQLTSLP